ncbi:competence protein CoiA family protein [Isachenkonia alkalipeptolytica]|uniref:Uncharacterized protein n=1 Tax=Isachenkonia alkalipeptolytica TaxID=2565777 RepID=A0AA44BDM3_9CLOT|nr:hypothetical protein [Isachenkonia alkalipeptolytica]
MLTANFKNEQYYSLDEDWHGRKEEMRKLLNNKAVCPLCKEPVICKFGDEKIHHFAHSQKGNCPSINDTEKHMKGVGLLYQNFLTNIDQYGLSHVSVNRVFEEEQFVADLELEFRNGKRLIIEYYGGHLKKKEIKKRNDYYEKNNIQIIWVIDSDYLEYIDDCIKLKPIFRKMKKINEVDKFYIGSWRTLILEEGLISELPNKDMASGTIIYFNAEEVKVSISRALSDTHHTGLFYPRKIIEGSLSDARITTDQETFYFEEEIELGLAFKKAKVKLQELEDARKLQRKRDEEIRRMTFEKDEVNLHNNQRLKDHTNGKWNGKWKENEGVHNIHAEKSKEELKKEVESKWFHCRRCGELKKEKEMYTYSFGSKAGVCNACGIKR